MTVPGIADHAHCEMCQTTVAVGERFCGAQACKEKHEQVQKDKKKQMWMMVLVIVAAVALSKLISLA